MHVHFRSLALLLGSIGFGFAATPSASAQSCYEVLRRSADQQAKVSVSVKELRIPQKAWQHFAKARAAAVAGQDELLEREANLALAIDPRFAEVYLLRATRQVHTLQYAAAVESIVAARRIDPEVAWSSTIMASALSELHRYNEAAAEMDRAWGAELESWQWKFEKAREEIARRNVAGALHWSELALATSPAGCTDAPLLRANAFQLAGRREEAVAQMEAFLASDRQTASHAEVQRVLEKTRASLQERKTTLVATSDTP